MNTNVKTTKKTTNNHEKNGKDKGVNRLDRGEEVVLKLTNHPSCVVLEDVSGYIL